LVEAKDDRAPIKTEASELTKNEASEIYGPTSTTSALHQQAAAPAKALNSSRSSEEGSRAVGLMAGDLIYLERTKDDCGGLSGIVFGDANLGTFGVEENVTEVKAGKGPWRFTNSVFRLISRLDYRARDEYSRQLESQNSVKNLKETVDSPTNEKEESLTSATLEHTTVVDPTKVEVSVPPPPTEVKNASPSDLDLAKERNDLEDRENVAALERMERGEGKSIR